VKIVKVRMGHASGFIFPDDGRTGHLVEPKVTWKDVLRRAGLKNLHLHDPALIPQQVRQTFPEPFKQVDVAPTGEEDLASIRKNPPDVVLLDLRLPGGSCLEIFEKIRGQDARIPVIFVTVIKAADAGPGRIGQRAETDPMPAILSRDSLCHMAEPDIDTRLSVAGAGAIR
jgi:CheY-like chemotaxis protein